MVYHNDPTKTGHAFSYNTWKIITFWCFIYQCDFTLQEKSEPDLQPKLTSLSLTNQESETKLDGAEIPVEDDLSLRAAIYGVLFQAYADKVGIWSDLFVLILQ